MNEANKKTTDMVRFIKKERRNKINIKEITEKTKEK